MKNARDDADMKKFMDDLAAVDFDDLEDDFRGVTVDVAQWEKYQTIVRALFAAQDKSGGKILKIDHLQRPLDLPHDLCLWKLFQLQPKGHILKYI